MLALEDRGADGGCRARRGDCGEQRVLGGGSEDAIGYAENSPEGQGVAGGGGGQCPAGGQQRAARPGGQDTDEDQVRPAAASQAATAEQVRRVSFHRRPVSQPGSTDFLRHRAAALSRAGQASSTAQAAPVAAAGRTAVTGVTACRATLTARAAVNAR